ncbi:MAG: 50S ribosomal protein L10 [Clostridia bacterium]|nr:50S ribosomal protein L10 [Clostridia bacterium]
MTKKISKQRIQKEAVVKSIKEKINKSKSIIMVSFNGLTVSEDTALRKELREQGIEYKVLKNSLIKRAFNELDYNQFDNDLNGTTSVAFSYNDEVAPAKIIAENAKKLKNKIEVKCGLLSGNYIDAVKVKELAALPTREVLIAKMLGSLNAPITKFAGVLTATLRSLVYAVKAVQEKKAQA